MTVKNFLETILNEKNGLSQDEIEKLQSDLEIELKQKEEVLNRILQIGRLLDYDEMKKNGFSVEEIAKIAGEDDEMLFYSKKFVENNGSLREHMFGYPANMSENSALVEYLKIKESELYLMNNCGDPYEEGNYLMDSKEFERKILDMFYKRFGIDKSKGWGSITSGGTESNKWGVYNGFKKYSNACLYFCESSHYSVEKSVVNGEKKLYPYFMVDQEDKYSEKIDKDKLFEKVKENWEKFSQPAIILLTWGTTKTGSIDDVKVIADWLCKNEIPHYIHLDAALFGGIPSNQLSAPVVPTFGELGIDSIAISFHKFFGTSDVKSIVITNHKVVGKHIAYIGQTDDTVAGSRTFRPFSTYQKIKETLERTSPEVYSKNVQYFENELKKNNIEYVKHDFSNIFAVRKPSESLCKYYQMASFTDKDGNDWAHIIVFPYHKKSVMDELIKDLKS